MSVAVGYGHKYLPNIIMSVCVCVCVCVRARMFYPPPPPNYVVFLQSRFAEALSEKAELVQSLQSMEHRILQLEMETDTIGTMNRNTCVIVSGVCHSVVKLSTWLLTYYWYAISCASKWVVPVLCRRVYNCAVLFAELFASLGMSCPHLHFSSVNLNCCGTQLLRRLRGREARLSHAITAQ